MKKCFSVMGQYWEDGVYFVAADSEAEVEKLLGDRWKGDFRVEELPGVTAPPPSRVIWPISL